MSTVLEPSAWIARGISLKNTIKAVAAGALLVGLAGCTTDLTSAGADATTCDAALSGASDRPVSDWGRSASGICATTDEFLASWDRSGNAMSGSVMLMTVCGDLSDRDEDFPDLRSTPLCQQVDALCHIADGAGPQSTFDCPSVLEGTSAAVTPIGELSASGGELSMPLETPLPRPSLPSRFARAASARCDLESADCKLVRFVVEPLTIREGDLGPELVVRVTSKGRAYLSQVDLGVDVTPDGSEPLDLTANQPVYLDDMCPNQTRKVTVPLANQYYFDDDQRAIMDTANWLALAFSFSASYVSADRTDVSNACDINS